VGCYNATIILQNKVYGITKATNAKVAEILPFLLLLIVFAADSRYNFQGEWICDNLAG